MCRSDWWIGGSGILSNTCTLIIVKVVLQLYIARYYWWGTIQFPEVIYFMSISQYIPHYFLYFVPIGMLVLNFLTSWQLTFNTKVQIFPQLWFEFLKHSLLQNQLKSVGKLKNFSKAVQSWNLHLIIYLYVDLVNNWSW